MGRVVGTGALRAHLIEARLAGTIATTREKSLARYRLFGARDPRALLGLDPEGDWHTREVLRLMGQECGVSVDPAHVSGLDVVDPDRTLAALDRFAERLGAAAGRRAPVLFGTGHPHRLVAFYAALADALSSAGCPVLTPAYGARVDIATRFGVRTCTLTYVRGVALMRETGVRGAPGTGAYTPIRRSRCVPLWRPRGTVRGRFRSW